MILIAPMGKVVKGNVLDCSAKSLERALKFYDNQLYLKWNEKKRQGWGTWEVRRRPDHKTAAYQGKFLSGHLFTLDYNEVDLESHVIDLPCLSYDVLKTIKKADTWAVKNWVDALEAREERNKARIEEKSKLDLKYNLKQFKHEWKDFAQYVSQGGNPGRVLSGNWGK